MRFKPSKRPELIAVFKKLDDELFQTSEKMKVKVLGGASVLLLVLRQLNFYRQSRWKLS